MLFGVKSGQHLLIPNIFPTRKIELMICPRLLTIINILHTTLVLLCPDNADIPHSLIHSRVPSPPFYHADMLPASIQVWLEKKVQVISFGICAFFASIELLSNDPVKSCPTWLLTARGMRS